LVQRPFYELKRDGARYTSSDALVSYLLKTLPVTGCTSHGLRDNWPLRHIHMTKNDIQFLKVFGCYGGILRRATQHFPLSAYRPLICYALEPPLLQQSP
jgi:hypothetical protein